MKTNEEENQLVQDGNLCKMDKKSFESFLTLIDAENYPGYSSSANSWKSEIIESCM